MKSQLLTLALVLMTSASLFGQIGLLPGTTVDVDAATGSDGGLGVVEASGRIFVTSRGNGALTTAPHSLYEFDCGGNLVATYEQSAGAATSAWGWRDACHIPGTSLVHFGYEGGVDVVDVSTLVAPGGPGAIVPVASYANATIGTFRGMAYDPTGDGGNGSIWTGSFGSALWEVAATSATVPQGTILTTFPLAGWSIYGLAYDSTTGNLWASSAPTNSNIAEIDTTAGVLTGVVIQRADPISAQGGLSPIGLGSPCTVSVSSPGGIQMVGLDQGTPDTYSFYSTAGTAVLTSGTGGGAQTADLTDIFGMGTLDWSLVSSPAGAVGVTGSPASTFVNLSVTGAAPASSVNGVTLPAFELALGFPYTTPASGGANASVLLADGLGLGTVPGIVDLSVAGLFPSDLTIDDATMATTPPLGFPAGGAIYAQSIFIDGGGNIRATNIAGWNYRRPIDVQVEANGANSFNATTTSGFFTITNVTGVDITDITFDWSASPNPAQASMVFDTDQTAMADRFDGGNSAVAGSLGTYRNGSDATVGLVYDALNTPSAAADPLANTGWIATNPTTAPSYRTVQFRFTSFNTAGQTFEFDIDTDGGAGINGSSMDGLVITITTTGGVLTGALVADPADILRSSAGL